MTNPIVIRFPPLKDLRAPKPEPHLTDAQWEQKWREGVARREAVQRLIGPPCIFHKRQAD